MAYQFSQIASIVRGKVAALHGDCPISELVMDSRRILFPESSLFFALNGPRRNGHEYITEAHRKGIRNFVISEPLSEIPAESNLIMVADTHIALQLLAGYHRHRFHIPVIGITGSNGKTIVKEWLNQLLEEDFRITRSPRSYNSQIGVPLSVWLMNEQTTLGIFEAGISQSGEMDKLQKIIQPTIGIFTNIGDAHAEGFMNAHQKINEKLRLFSNVEILIYCKDYPELNEGVASLWRHRKTGDEKPFRMISWSSHTKAELFIHSRTRDQDRTVILGDYLGSDCAIVIPFTDEASIENAITCWCVLLHLNIPEEQIRQRMEKLSPVSMRLELRDGINNTSVINDSYSADLSSLRIALDFLAQQHQHTRQTVILTDFLETGRNERELYRSIAFSLQQHAVSQLIGIGPVICRNHAIFESVPGLQTQFLGSVKEFQEQFPRMSFGNENILIKGARIFGLEQIYHLFEKQTHQTLLEIDLDALVHNLRAYQQLLRPSTKLMAMVKAFSYGSGSYEIAAALEFNKVDYLAVAYADEGVELRKGGISLPVMVMNPDESAFPALLNYNLEPEIYSLKLLVAFSRFLRQEGLTHIPIHIELETGMNRLGFEEKDLEELCRMLDTNTFRVQSVFSHLVASEDSGLDYFTRVQAEKFERMSGQLKERLPYTFLRHLLNTSGIVRHPGLQYDMVRTGIGLYGVDATGTLDLRQVSTLRSAIAQIKEVAAGESVSYGRSGKAERDSRVATIRLGYADGYPRSLGNGRGKVMIGGRLLPTIGNINMDMTMIDITGVADVDEGSPVVVFGKDLPVQQVAEWAGTIPYEILTGLSQRVKRVYFRE